MPGSRGCPSPPLTSPVHQVFSLVDDRDHLGGPRFDEFQPFLAPGAWLAVDDADGTERGTGAVDEWSAQVGADADPVYDGVAGESRVVAHVVQDQRQPPCDHVRAPAMVAGHG